MTNKDDTKQEKGVPNTEYDEYTKIKFTGGHEFDGIRELDNRLPPWLKYLFYITIVFAFSYLMLVFVFKDDRVLQEKEYENEMAAVQGALEEMEDSSSETVAAPKSEAQILAEGKNTFDNICSVCHGKNGEGLVGPNMTDQYWIHGGSLEDMRNVVLNGVIAKGMISYRNQLSSSQIESVLRYIQSLQGTNPPNAKAPQGELYVPPETETPVATDTTEAQENPA